MWEWRTWEHLDPAKETITEIQGDRSEWTHGNAIMELPDRDLLVSFRDISTIIKIERRRGRMVWKLGAPPLSGQHAPTPLPSGNLLVNMFTRWRGRRTDHMSRSFGQDGLLKGRTKLKLPFVVQVLHLAVFKSGEYLVVGLTGTIARTLHICARRSPLSSQRMGGS